MSEHKNTNLENKAVFTHRDQKLGIPSKVFFGTLFLSIFATFVFVKYLPTLLGLLVSAAVTLIILIPAYLVHKDDPDAYIVWLRGLFAPARLTTVRSTRRRVLVLEPQEDGSFKPKPIA
ncbi:hypothetical protein LZ023_40805 (plasmid) [Pseudomonas silvicola]|nr:hypothetical protein LZ023_41080 [Pseudomonas silvicola]WAH62276.1 hypothetical protein LZ023_40805 [Pseudomonas silvicola]